MFKIAEGIEDEEKILFEGKTAEVMTSLMPEILAEATTFLGIVVAMKGLDRTAKTCTHVS